MSSFRVRLLYSGIFFWGGGGMDWNINLGKNFQQSAMKEF